MTPRRRHVQYANVKAALEAVAFEAACWPITSLCQRRGHVKAAFDVAVAARNVLSGHCLALARW